MQIGNVFKHLDLPSDRKALPLGLYRIFWKEGGTSLAAIGQTENGEKWVAPCNWVNWHPPGPKHREIWDKIDKVKLLYRWTYSPSDT